MPCKSNQFWYLCLNETACDANDTKYIITWSNLFYDKYYMNYFNELRQWKQY